MPRTTRPHRPFTVFLAGVAVLVVAIAGCAGCGGDKNSAEPAGCTKVKGTSFTLVARDLSWQPDCIEVKAGTTVTFTIKLEDVGVQHNLVISGLHAQTKLQTGPITQHLTVTFPSRATSYGFKCSIHPNMTGTIYAV